MTGNADNEPPIRELVDKESVDILPYIGWVLSAVVDAMC